MKDSPHHRKHLKHKAIKEANAIENSGPSPELIQNPDFKKQFEAKQTSLPHKLDKRLKQTSKRTSPKEVKHETEPHSVHGEHEHWGQVIKTQTHEKNLLLNKKLSKQTRK